MKAIINGIECKVVKFDEETKEYLLDHDGFTGWFNWNDPDLTIIEDD